MEYQGGARKNYGGWTSCAAAAALVLLLLCSAPARADAAGAGVRAVIRSGPPQVTSQRQATISFVAEGDSTSFECRMDSGPWGACESPVVLRELSEGEHKFYVRATEGTEAVASHTWSVDTKPPSTEIHTGPTQLSASTEATFQFAHDGESEVGAKAMCQLDQSGFTGCSSPMTYTGLTEGEHKFVVKVTDSAGNKNESTAWAWHVDVPPSCRVTHGAPGAAHPEPSTLTAPFPVRFEWSEAVEGFSGGKVTVGGVGGALTDWRAQAGGRVFTATVKPRVNGRVTVQVASGAAKDQRGQLSSPSNTLSVVYDGTPPTCSLSGPSAKQSAPFQVTFDWSEPVVGFSAAGVVLEGAATFEGKFEPMGSRFIGTVTPHGTGQVKLSLRDGAAVDLAGTPSVKSLVLTIAITNSNLFVSEKASQRTRAIGANREVVGTLEGVATETAALEVDSAGYVYVGRGGEVEVYAGWGAPGQKPAATLAGFSRVAGLDVHEAEASAERWLCVADADRHHVKVFHRRGGDEWALLRTIGAAHGGASAAAHGLNTPLGVEFHGDSGRLYVADSANARVQVFDLDGEHISTLSHAANVSGGRSAPAAVEVDTAGRVFVADPAAGVVAVYDQGGALEQLLTGAASAGLTPVAVETDRFGVIYVADAASRRVHTFDAALAYGGVLEGVSDPTAIGLYRDEVAPNVTMAGPTEEQHGAFEVNITFSEPVSGFGKEGVVVGGAGGVVTALVSRGAHYIATVAPASVGLVTVKVRAGAVADAEGNLNAADSNTVTVSYFAGECSLELGCQWQLAMYQHQLALDRLSEESALETQRAVEVQRVQEKAAQRREELKLEAEAAGLKMKLQAEADMAALERETIQERAAAEADQRIREARENEELERRKMTERAEQTRRTVLATVDAVFGYLATGAQELLSDTRKLQTVVATVGAVAVSIYCARELAATLAQQLRRWLGQPALVRYSTRSVLPWTKLLIWLRRSPAPFADVVLEDKLLARMQEVATSTLHTKRRGAPFRNLLLYGLPGTGKTMAAERLAKSVGMDYAMMSGGDVVPLGKTAVSELHHLFDWAQTSSRGVLLLIDEADAFLRNRDKSDMGEYMRSALNAVLARTGVQSTNFMLVCVTNRPDDLDPAIMDRMDELVEFPPPAPKQRRALMEMYLDKYLPTAAQAKKASLAVDRKGVDEQTFAKLAAITEGFSGRDLAKLMAAVQARVYGKAGGAAVVTPMDMLEVAELKKAEHDRRLNGFNVAEAAAAK